MSMKKGSFGVEVGVVQKVVGAIVDNSFGSETEAKVKVWQKQHGLDDDGIVGPLTWAAITKAAGQSGPIIGPISGEAPWMDWLKQRNGWTEFDHDKELSAYWKYSGLDYTTVIGASHAWCALTVNASLHDTGYKGNNRADAVSFEHYGTPCGFVYGAIVPIRHKDGSHHVSFFDHWADQAGKIAALRGGNQGNSICVANFNLSGNAHGHDECINGPRWPAKV